MQGGDQPSCVKSLIGVVSPELSVEEECRFVLERRVLQCQCRLTTYPACRADKFNERLNGWQRGGQAVPVQQFARSRRVKQEAHRIAGAVLGLGCNQCLGGEDVQIESCQDSRRLEEPAQVWFILKRTPDVTRNRFAVLKR